MFLSSGHYVPVLKCLLAKHCRSSHSAPWAGAQESPRSENRRAAEPQCLRGGRHSLSPSVWTSPATMNGGREVTENVTDISNTQKTRNKELKQLKARNCLSLRCTPDILDCLYYQVSSQKFRKLKLSILKRQQSWHSTTVLKKPWEKDKPSCY